MQSNRRAGSSARNAMCPPQLGEAEALRTDANLPASEVTNQNSRERQQVPVRQFGPESSISGQTREKECERRSYAVSLAARPAQIVP